MRRLWVPDHVQLLASSPNSLWTRDLHLAPSEWINLPITAPCIIRDHKGDILLTRWKSPLCGMSLHGDMPSPLSCPIGEEGFSFPHLGGQYYKRHGLQPCWRSWRQSSTAADSWTPPKCELLCDGTPRKACHTQKTPLDHAALSVFITSMAFIIKTPGHLADKIAYLSQNLINSQHERSLLYTVGNLMHHQEKWVRCTNYYS